MNLCGPISLALSVAQLRGGRFEAEHPISAVLTDASGRVLEAVGPELTTTWRSAAKPFQLEVSLGLLPPATRDALGERELALGAASHSAEPAHLERVAAILRQVGCDEGGLYCGAHLPLHAPAAHALLRAGEAASPRHNNCSGKHAFMAGASRAQGWSEDYRGLFHPLQQRIRARVAELAGAVPEAVVDGCGVPCWVLPLSGMARAWAGLASAMAAGESTGLGRIGWAMQRNPWFVSGTDRADGALMAAAKAPLLCKVGAEGLMCGALPGDGVGFAVKVHSGHGEVRDLAAAAVLDRWFPGLVPFACAAPWGVVRNVVGDPVGTRVSAWVRHAR